LQNKSDTPIKQYKATNTEVMTGENERM